MATGTSIYGTGFENDGADQRSEEKETLTTYQPQAFGLPFNPWIMLAVAGLVVWYFTKKKG